MSHSCQIYPSLLAADFSRLKDEVQAVEEAGADALHLDVMDGHFVPNLTFGPALVKALRPHSKLFFDCHLMVQNPESLIEPFADAGAGMITVHQETCPHLHGTLQKIRNLGLRAGVAINPATPLSQVEHVLEDIDLLLCMTVNPGFGGQKLIANALEKAGQAVQQLKARGLDQKVAVQIDGGVGPQNAAQARELGINILVAGSSIFGQSDYRQAIDSLR